MYSPARSDGALTTFGESESPGEVERYIAEPTLSITGLYCATVTVTMNGQRSLNDREGNEVGDVHRPVRSEWSRCVPHRESCSSWSEEASSG